MFTVLDQLHSLHPGRPEGGEEAAEGLRMLGASEWDKVGYRASYAIIGMKGASNGKSFAELSPGEFLFVPVGQNSGSVLVQLEASGGTIVAEYAYFTKV